MKTLKSTTKSEVQLLMDFDYNNVLGRIKYVLGKEATLFSDVLIKNSEIYWMVRDDSEYVSLTELSSDVQSEVKGILNRRISYVSGIISGDSLIGVYSDKILTYPSDEYVFVKEGTGNGDIIITGWGCMSSAHDNNDASHVEETTEELSGGTNTVEWGAFNSSHNGNETSICPQTNNEQPELVCPKCMTTYPAGSIFCPRDGEKLITPNNLVYYCEKCGTQYSSDTKFCPKDGGAVVCRVAGQHYSRKFDSDISFKKASLGLRFIASLLDGLICGVLAIPAIILYAIGLSNVTYNYDYYYQDYSKARGFFFVALILYLIPITYAFIKDGLGNGQSWGKKAMGLRTIKVKDYSKCTKGASALRVLVSTLVSMIPLVGWFIEPIMVLTTSDGRRLADKAAGTMVVNSK